MALENEENSMIGDRDTIQTKLSDDSAEITVWSYFRGGWAGSPCESKVDTTLGGYPAIRYTCIEETDNGCGEVTGFTTLIAEDPTTSYALSYYSLDGTEADLSKFLIIEDSLVINKL